MNLRNILFIFCFLLSSTNAYAYIDPGTGGILHQAILAAIAAIGAYVTLYWRKFKNFMSRIFKIKKKN